ncbi:Protein with carboxyl methyl esterase activity, variant 3 [Orbilia oligospora]|nr:Protein with carboxyl methyl esterase activity, variant 2 [Orbilia oligospora]KAF3297252.1 Protein with carboxyl methyl esterase activity, variant 3 [Orbilia oligospora]
MSALGRDFFKAKLAKLPAMPPPPLGALPEELEELEELDIEDEDEDDFPDGYGENDEYHEGILDDSSSASSASSTSTIIAPPSRPELTARRRNNLEPIPWNHHFSENLHLTPSSNPTSHFNAYYTPNTGSGPLFVTHHGAGSSGLSFAALASEIRKINPEAGIFSFDARGHGGTSTSNDQDFSLSTLSTDLYEALLAAQEQLRWESLPPIILVGHSLGGAVITDLAKRGLLGDRLLAYAVLDVVEGSAMDALHSMQSYLLSRPTGFTSLNQGIEWHVRSRTIRNGRSARVSVPALLYDYSNSGGSGDASSSSSSTATTSSGATAVVSNGRPWRWRTDLATTQPFWQDWFVGLSRKFLEAKGGKLLILAGTDRLDKELIIGQMQGKYQLLVLPEVGHFLHEDAPEKTAIAVSHSSLPFHFPPFVILFALF